MPKFFTLYAIRTKMQEAELQNKHIEYAEAGEDFNKRPEIRLRFDRAGSRIWERMTTENKGRYLAIIIDKKVISAPHVDETISGGVSSLSGGFKSDEVEMLARQLNAGYMPAELTIIRSDITVEPASPSGKKIGIAVVLFLVTAGLTFFIINSLKRNRILSKNAFPPV
jgi:preprotein translocase subunit SecD